jgi:hypothetical protein
MCRVCEPYFSLLQSGHGHWSHRQRVQAERIMRGMISPRSVASVLRAQRSLYESDERGAAAVAQALAGAAVREGANGRALDVSEDATAKQQAIHDMPWRLVALCGERGRDAFGFIVGAGSGSNRQRGPTGRAAESADEDD